MRIIISGAGGRMGRIVAEKAAENGISVLAGVDVRPFAAEFPVFTSIDQVEETPDLVIDFSHPSALPSLLAFALKKRVALLLCATGYSEEDLLSIERASKEIPVFRTANLSLGINVLLVLVKKAAAVLHGYDVEIVEMHHNKKIDAPSGTAKMLLEAVQSVEPDDYPVYDRHAVRKPRDPNEIGMHSLRGGTVVGEHTVYFAGSNEVLTLSHKAESRVAFSEGAVRAMFFMKDVAAPGLYSMDDVVAGLL
ncbi:MAG: 4-hydroxy-tetrahydrodipicolinate reductase [Clostridia bacterium]|nr:4-hydroxy-tetrahydrodipicolinate reductase [Clostridia bacterium]